MSRFIRLSAAALLAGSLSLTALAEPAIWTLSDEDTTINLIGTVHYLPDDLNWRSERINAAFKRADTVCFEVDVEARALETTGMMFNQGVFKDGDRLVNHLTDDQETELRETAEEFGIPFISLNVMKPWFVSLTLEEYRIERMGLGEGVEFTLYPEVTALGKEICEMETPQEQLGSWIGMDLDDQVDVLFQRPEGTEELGVDELIAFSEEQLEDLIDEWVDGDVEALGELIDTEAGLNEKFHEALLVTRNTNWVPRIEAMLEEKSGNILIAVGAAHLAGDDSVIKMLRDRGHKIDGP